ncbi:MAG: hypothetical protein WC584_05270 [Candidatus Pacearchaeota archaeon]
MRLILSEKLPRILKNKRLLEEKLNVKITNRGKEVFVNGSSENEYIAEKVIDAINFGFPISDAFLILDEEFLFEIINIKEHTKRKDLNRIKARIIGTKGKTFQTLCHLTKCCFELKDNEVGIIGSAECIKNAEDAVKSLIHGSKQANVYSKLEKNQPEPISDLGLKIKKKK